MARSDRETSSILVSLLYDEMQFHLYSGKHFEVSQTTETIFLLIKQHMPLLTSFVLSFLIF